MKFYHIIDINERGQYACHVEDENGKTVWSASTEESETGEFWPVVDGFMGHVNDMAGLSDYLGDLGIIPTRTLIINRK